MSDAQAPTQPPESEHLAELRTQLRAVKTAMAQALKSESPETVLRAAAASTELLDQIKAEEAKASEARKQNRHGYPKGKKKATALMSEERAEAVFRMLVKGETRAMILRNAAKDGWNLKSRQIDGYIQKATERFRAISQFDREEQIGTAVSRYIEHHRLAIEAGDTRAAADAQGRLCKLLGLDAPTMARVLTINTDPAALEAMSDDALADLIQKIG